jgi:transcriptional regulator with XRE-family HTH domain
MTTENGRAFNEWLRAQLKAKKMSQRQLAQQSGVDHSTISRLIRGDRMPSLGTATKLARGLREIREDSDASAALGIVSAVPQNPTARVEYALRADEALTEPQVRQIMEYYLAVRVRRFARTYASVGTAEPVASSAAHTGGVYGRPSGMAGSGVGHGVGNGVGAPAAVRAAPPSRYAAPRPAVRPARTPGRP